MPQNSRPDPDHSYSRSTAVPSPAQSVRRQPAENPALSAKRREAVLRQRRKARRKRILILAAAAVLILALLAVIVVFLAKTIIGIVSGGREGKHPGNAVTDTVNGEDTGETGETDPVSPVTEPPVTLPPYDAPAVVRGTPVTPHKTDAALELDTEIDCPYMLLMDASTGEILAEKNADSPIYPASMTKLMTMLAAYELLPDLDATFRMTNTIIDPLYLDGLSLAGFIGGEEVTIRDLLYGTALPSGAEAAVGLAIAACGSEEAFVEVMNRRAASLGMTGTHFTNCSGHHDDDHYSTLGDIAVLLAYMEQDETLKEILSTYQYTTEPTPQHPEGVLLTSTVFMRMEGSESVACEVIGGKTGFTAQAGQCLATCGVRYDTGRAFICVLAGGDTKWKPVYDTIALFGNYTQP